MHATFKTFKCKDGDCIFLILNDNDDQFVIMTDCGFFEKNIEKYIREYCHCHINLLIVTHIDQDHILGVTKMMQKVSELHIDKIIYNSYKRNNGPKRKLTKTEQNWLDSIKPEIQPVALDILEHNISANQSIDLASVIMSLGKFETKWNRDTILTGSCIDLDKWGIIKFVSPEQQDIDALNEEFYSAFYKLLYFDAAKVNLKDGESIYELILRYVDAFRLSHEENKISAVPFTTESVHKLAEIPARTNEITPNNKASLAYVWESKDNSHRILVMGDANPDTVVKGLMKTYPEGKRPLIMDAIKVSHHGSHFNTTNELLRQADSQHYFFTGGAEGVRPHENTIAKIISNPISEDIPGRTLHFNYNTSLIGLLIRDRTIQKEFHFHCDKKVNQYDFDF